MFKDAEPGLLATEWEMAFHTFFGDDNHFARFNFADEFGANNVERTGLRRQNPAFANFAQHQWAHAQWITAANQLGSCHSNNRKRALDFA